MIKMHLLKIPPTCTWPRCLQCLTTPTPTQRQWGQCIHKATKAATSLPQHYSVLPSLIQWLCYTQAPWPHCQWISLHHSQLNLWNVQLSGLVILTKPNKNLLNTGFLFSLNWCMVRVKKTQSFWCKFWDNNGKTLADNWVTASHIDSVMCVCHSPCS